MIPAATGAMALVMVSQVKEHGLPYLLAASVLTPGRSARPRHAGDHLSVFADPDDGRSAQGRHEIPPRVWQQDDRPAAGGDDSHAPPALSSANPLRYPTRADAVSGCLPSPTCNAVLRSVCFGKHVRRDVGYGLWMSGGRGTKQHNRPASSKRTWQAVESCALKRRRALCTRDFAPGRDRPFSFA